LKDLPKIVLKSKKFPILMISIVVFFALIIGFMFLMGYLPQKQGLFLRRAV